MNEPSRRTFTCSLATLAAAPLVAPFAAADTPADPTVAVTTALAEIARVRFGKHLSDEDVKHVRRGIYRDQYGAALLRQVKLRNGDEPATIFRAEVP